MLSDYGELTEFFMMKNKMTGQSRGCGFIRYATREQAEAAMHNLHEKRTLPGVSCSVWRLVSAMPLHCHAAPPDGSPYASKAC